MVPYLSVIVPIYKAEPFLETCIESLIHQTFYNLEIILVDDGSPDRCPQICDAYACKDARVKVIHQANKGSVRARLNGALASSGSYLTFVDADDWIEEDMYSILAELAVQNNPDVIISGILRDHDGIPEPCTITACPGFYQGKNLTDLKNAMLYNGRFYHAGISPNLAAKLFRRSVLLPNMKSVDERITYGDDMVCTYPCLLDAESVLIYTERYFYHYRYHPSSMTMVYDEDYFKKHRYLYEYLQRCFSEKNRPDLNQQLMYHQVFTSIFGVMREVGKPANVLFGTGMQRLRSCLNNPDLSAILANTDSSRLEIPFPYRQVYLAMRKKSFFSLLFLLQLMRGWAHFFWES